MIRQGTFKVAYRQVGIEEELAQPISQKRVYISFAKETFILIYRKEISCNYDFSTRCFFHK
jgi:hypothetical protein